MEEKQETTAVEVDEDNNIFTLKNPGMISFKADEEGRIAITLGTHRCLLKLTTTLGIFNSSEGSTPFGAPLAEAAVVQLFVSIMSFWNGWGEGAADLEFRRDYPPEGSRNRHDGNLEDVSPGLEQFVVARVATRARLSDGKLCFILRRSSHGVDGKRKCAEIYQWVSYAQFLELFGDLFSSKARLMWWIGSYNNELDYQR